MSALQKRVYSRNAYEAPIMYTNYDTENYYHAKCITAARAVCISSQKELSNRDQIFVLRW